MVAMPNYAHSLFQHRVIPPCHNRKQVNKCVIFPEDSSYKTLQTFFFHQEKQNFYINLNPVININSIKLYKWKFLTLHLIILKMC